MAIVSPLLLAAALAFLAQCVVGGFETIYYYRIDFSVFVVTAIVANILIP